MSNIIISPSILSCDFLNVEKEINALNLANNIWIHLDVMDGHFVPNLTFGHPLISKLSKITTHPLDAHFMVTNPEFYLDTMKNYNIYNFTFHLEALANTKEVLSLIKKAKQHFKSVGISVRPKTKIKDIDLDILQNIDLFLMMSVEPGFGGQGFIEESKDKIIELNTIRKSKNFNFQIQIDGGISDKNANDLVKIGVTNLVAGSYVFKNGPDHYLEKIESLRKK